MDTITQADSEIVLDFFIRLASLLNEADPLIEAEAIPTGDDEQFTLKVRLTTEHACAISPAAGGWSVEMLEMMYGEWAYVGDDPPELNHPVPGFAEPVTDALLRPLAEAIDEMAEDFRWECGERKPASVREYFRLGADTRNPTFVEGQNVEGWTGQRGFNEGTIFVVLRESGQPAQLYPAGRCHEAIPRDSELFRHLRPQLSYTPSPFRSVLLEERADPVSILEELIRRDITTYEDVYSLME